MLNDFLGLCTKLISQERRDKHVYPNPSAEVGKLGIGSWILDLYQYTTPAQTDKMNNHARVVRRRKNRIKINLNLSDVGPLGNKRCHNGNKLSTTLYST